MISFSISNGNHVFKAYLQNSNDQIDQNSSNNQSKSTFNAFTLRITLPFSKTFKGGIFTTNNWTVIKSYMGITHEIA